MSRTQILWCLFAWIGVPLVFVGVVLLSALPFRSQAALLIATLAFLTLGICAIAKGQRPRRTWIVLLYPIPMFFILVAAASAVALLSNRGV